MLTELCPFFLTIKTVARKEWLEMPSAVAAAPPSPGASSASSRLMEALGVSPRSGQTTPRKISSSSPADGLARLPEAPGSPTPGSRRVSLGLGPPISPSKPPQWSGRDEDDSMPSTPARRLGEIAGPASPGRVKRVGGLRDVRERIRRALGE